MKRAHRKAHRAMWFALAPAIIAIMVMALVLRPDEPVSEAAPERFFEGDGRP